MTNDQRELVTTALRKLRGQCSQKVYARGFAHRTQSQVSKAEAGFLTLDYLLEVRARHGLSLDALLDGALVVRE